MVGGHPAANQDDHDRCLRRAGPRAGFAWCDHSHRFYLAPDWPYALHGDLDPWAWERQVHDLQTYRPRATRDAVRSSFQPPPSEGQVADLAAELMKPQPKSA